jgi:hypothetical protein
MLEEAHVRFAQWRLGSPKRGRRSNRWGLSILLLALLLFVLAMQPLVSPRSRFFRGPSDAPHMTPQEMIANEIATEAAPLAERVMVHDTAADALTVERPTQIQEGMATEKEVVAAAEETAGPLEHNAEDTADGGAAAAQNAAPEDLPAENRIPESLPANNAATDAVEVDNAATESDVLQDAPDEDKVPEEAAIENTVSEETPADDNIPNDVPVLEIITENEGERDHEDGNPTDEDIQIPPVTSVLHPHTPYQAPLNPNISFSIKSSNDPFDEYNEAFPQYGKTEPGLHHRLQNTRLLTQVGNRESDSVLIISVFNDAESWGTNRSMTDFFDLVGSLDYPKQKVSIALLTSSMDEFSKAKQLFGSYVTQYPRLSVIFRNDFTQTGLNRINRHQDSLQGGRRRMLARYRNYALLSTLESWHQHVVWLDADINVIPPGLLLKMVRSNRDIVEPICLRKYNVESDDNYDYDLNAWVGQRRVRPADREEDEGFVPGLLHAKNLHDLGGQDEFVALDSVGGTMLYVRADVHRQGVIFPAHYIIGSEWSEEGYDGIETEGLCYSAHFLGFKCWGLPNDAIFHAT